MRFLFAIQGEGRGHLTQALSLAEMLRRHGHELVGVLVGRSALRTLPAFFYAKIGAPVTEFETPQFAFDHSNRSVSMFRTLLCNATPERLRAFDRSMHLIRDRIEALCPDRIINFYELLTGFTVRRFGIRIPMTGIAHQFLLNHLLYRHSRRKGIQGILLRLHAHMTAWGCNDLLALSFQPMPDDFQRHIYVVPPLLRHEALEGKASDEGFILGYMVNNGFADELRHWCAQHPHTVSTSSGIVKVVRIFGRPRATSPFTASTTASFSSSCAAAGDISPRQALNRFAKRCITASR